MPMRAFADAVRELLDELGIPRATVVGLSMGGLVAMELALAHPERVTGVVLAATTAAPVTPRGGAHPPGDRRRDRARRDARGGARHGRPAARPAGRRDPELLTHLFRMMFHAPPAGAAAALRGRAERPDYATLLRGLRVPALVIAGDHDPYAPEPVVEQLVGALPDPQVLRLAGTGHLPNMEAPEAFNAALAAFALGRAGQDAS
jgi:pimeloyl-ACP methyl ester carboxylesterase